MHGVNGFNTVSNEIHTVPKLFKKLSRHQLVRNDVFCRQKVKCLMFLLRPVRLIKFHVKIKEALINSFKVVIVSVSAAILAVKIRC